MQTANTMTVEALAGNAEVCAQCGAKVHAATERGKQVLPWYLDREYLRTHALTAMGLTAPVTQRGASANGR